MYQVVEASYVISAKEMIVMLKGLDYGKCYGLIKNELELSEKEIYTTLNNMAKKEMIISEEGAFHVCMPYKKIVEQMAEAELVFVVHKKEGIRDCCYYMKEKETTILKCEKMPMQENLRFSLITKEQLQEEIVQKDRLKDELNEKLFSQEEEEEKGIYEDFFTSLKANEAVINMTEIIRVQEKIKCSLLIVTDVLTEYIMVSDEEGLKREPYTEENYKRFIKQYTGGWIF